MSETTNKTNTTLETKNNQESNNPNQEKENVPPKKDIMKEKVNELKAVYEQMIKLRKQNLENFKKIDMSKK